MPHSMVWLYFFQKKIMYDISLLKFLCIFAQIKTTKQCYSTS